MIDVKIDPKMKMLASMWKAVNSAPIIEFEMRTFVEFMQNETVRVAKRNVQKFVYDTPQPDGRERTHTLERAIRKRPVQSFVYRVHGLAEVSRDIIAQGGYSGNGYYYAWIVDQGKHSGRGANRYPKRPFWTITMKEMKVLSKKLGVVTARSMAARLAGKGR